MKVLTQGHKYVLNNFENESDGQTIQFIEKQLLLGEFAKDATDGTMVTINDGTTNEEVLAMLIDRMIYLQNRFACRENALAITKLEEALMWLNKRTVDRIKRNVEGKHLV